MPDCATSRRPFGPVWNPLPASQNATKPSDEPPRQGDPTAQKAKELLMPIHVVALRKKCRGPVGLRGQMTAEGRAEVRRFPGKRREGVPIELGPGHADEVGALPIGGRTENRRACRQPLGDVLPLHLV